MPYSTRYRDQSQSGSAMLMALLILIVLTLLGVFASSSGIMQERMSGNFRDSARAFEAAEAGARWIEAWFASLRDLADQPFVCDGNCVVGQNVVWAVDNYQADFPQLSNTWWDNNAADYGLDPGSNPLGPAVNVDGNLDATVPEVHEQPRIIVEHTYFKGDTLDIGSTGVNFYRITSRATGAIPGNNNVAIVQSTFARRYE